MKIKVTQAKLSKALNNVSRIAIGKVTLPILNNVLIRVDNKKVSLVTTNLDMAVVDFLPVSSSEDGVVTVPAKLLAEFVSNLPKGETIEIEVNELGEVIGDYELIDNKIVFKLENVPYPKVRILKVDPDGNALLGAKLKLTDINGNGLNGLVLVNGVFKILVEDGFGVFVIDNQLLKSQCLYFITYCES